MGIITKIESQKKRDDRVNIYGWKILYGNL